MSTRAWIDSKRHYLTTSRSTPPPLTVQQKPIQLHIGDRVQVNSLHGIIRFIGTTKFKAGTWAGIELDNIGLGKNDGSVEGKRYFICPPNTGIFILTIKLIKQQHYLALQNRPSTPHHTTTINTTSLPPTPPLPPTIHNNKKSPLSPNNSTNNNNNNETQKLKHENKLLKEKNENLEQTIKEIKLASMNSIEILENLISTHQKKIKELENNLLTEKLKYNELRRNGLEAIELTILELENSNQKSQKLIHENELLQKRHHIEIQILLQDINVLETVLQDKINLLNSLKNTKSYSTIRLDSPIQEVDEEDEDEEICLLCHKKGHHLIHCKYIIK